MTSKIKFRSKPSKVSQTPTRMKRRLLVETLCERRVLATVTGMVFDDDNANWRPDAEEASLAGRLVFIDTNDNGLPDDGEAFALTDIDGSFSLEELGSDDQIVRLFSGAPSQSQLFPIHPDADAGLIELSDFEPAAQWGNLLVDPAGGRGLVRAADGVIVVDFSARETTVVSLGAEPVAAEFLPDGRILVLASDSEGNRAFLVDADGSSQAIQLLDDHGDNAELPWAAVAIDAQGHGLLVAGGETASPAWRLVASESGITSAPTSTEISPRATLLSGGSITTLIAEPVEQGLALTLWSNATGTVIGQQGEHVVAAQSVLGYSDATDLVFVLATPQGEEASATVLVLDAAAEFALLQTITDLDPLVAIDMQRSVVLSLAVDQSRLRAIDALSGQTIADWAIDLDLAEAQTEIALHNAGQELLLLSPAGLAAVALDRMDAHRVKLDGSVASYPLRFAVNVDGDNQVPVFNEPLEFDVVQGVPLILGAGGLIADADDPDGDPFVVIRSSSPQHGVATVTPQGGMSYTANADFVGTDSFEIFLHDGRGASATITVQINVAPLVIPDPDVLITVLPVPENAQPGFVVGHIEIIGFGTGPLVYVIEDPRFEVVDDLILVVAGADLDYEDEYLITTNLTVSDPDTGESVTRSFTVELSDENDPIEDILPREASIFENVFGESIVELTIINQDSERPFFLTVDDERFEVVNRTLRLKPGIALDHESEPEVVINVTASDARGGSDSLTVPFTITVIDVPEQATSIVLTNATVFEFVAGAVVGDVIVDGNPLRDSYTASVDDSRFEIVDGVLKLRDGEFLVRSVQQEAQVIITVQDAGRVFAATAEMFVISVLENENPFINPDNAFDVNGDGIVTPLDALLILNAIQRNGGGGPVSQFPRPGMFWDVNGDGLITPLDALLILNFINQQNRQIGVGEPESVPPAGEAIAAAESIAQELLAPSGASGDRSLAADAAPLIESLQHHLGSEPLARLALLGERLQQALTSPRGSEILDRVLERLSPESSWPEVVATFRADLERLQQSLSERLAGHAVGDPDALQRARAVIAERVLTPENRARIELLRERISGV